MEQFKHYFKTCNFNNFMYTLTLINNYSINISSLFCTICTNKTQMAMIWWRWTDYMFFLESYTHYLTVRPVLTHWWKQQGQKRHHTIGFFPVDSLASILDNFGHQHQSFFLTTFSCILYTILRVTFFTRISLLLLTQVTLLQRHFT